jgi:hypothetical protein
MMTASDAINELASALAKAQAAIKPASKDSVNPHFKSRYADLASIWEACRTALTSQGLSVVQLPEQGPDLDTISLTTVLLHESGQYISGTISAPLARRDAQGIGSALTYLRRYALAAMVGIVADEDDDGSSAVQPAPQRAVQSSPARPVRRAADPVTGEVRPPRDLGPVKLLVDEIRTCGGDPGTITPRKLLDMPEAEFAAYVGGMRRLRDDLITLNKEATNGEVQETAA